jgi:hypothetical protein
MSRNDSEFDIYHIPPNFIEGGTVMGGLFKLRNVIEAGILAFFVGVPIFMLDFDVTAKVMVICFTALPLALLALIGVCLSFFLCLPQAFVRMKSSSTAPSL